jgi:hypothetical protein
MFGKWPRFGADSTQRERFRRFNVGVAVLIV